MCVGGRGAVQQREEEEHRGSWAGEEGFFTRQAQMRKTGTVFKVGASGAGDLGGGWQLAQMVLV